MDTNRRIDFKSSSIRWHFSDDDRRAFTLTELLVVLATLAILAVLLLPVLASTQPASAKAFQCLNNLRQMAMAWTLYSGDNHDRLVNNFDVASTQLEIQNKTYRNWANDVMDWTVTPSITNLDGLKLAPFYQYTGGTGMYRCPADNYLSALQRNSGWTVRPRSYSMNAFFGATTPTWTSSGNQFYPSYRQFLKIGGVSAPSNMYVMLEEHPDSINDSYFLNTADPTIQKWSDLPGSNHAGAAGFSFADGHSEIHQWKSRLCTILPVKFGLFPTPAFSADPSGAALQDGRWLASHSSVPR
jgi:prepilin-type N-terminal cleavage/methylation domain-containing protein/prepilin-type processing-associated H-X9-DG protein